MSKQVFANIGSETLKGQAIQQLKDAVAAGCREVTTLRLASNVADQETLTLGSTVFEVHVLNTDTTANSTVLDSTANLNVVETITAHGLAVGRILRCEAEFLKVVAVVDANKVELSRGYAGSTIASHADGTDIFKGAQAPAAGRVPLPTGATLTPTAFSALAVTGLNALNVDGITAVAISVNEVLLSREKNGAALAVAETLGGSNNAFDGAAFHGGVEPADGRFAVVTRVPTAQEVALDALHAVFPFTVKFARVTVRVTADGTAIAWDGAVTLSGTRVTVGNGGATDWTASHTVFIEAFG